MPRKLLLVNGFYVFHIITDLLTKQWLEAVIGALSLFGLLKCNDGVRRLLIVLAWIGLIAGLAVGALLVMGVAAGAEIGLIHFASLAVSLSANGFFIWCLRQDDV